jgi:hypothetical protein
VAKVSRPEFKVNLQKLLSRAYADRAAKRVLSPILQQRSVKLEFGRRLIDEIVRRTQEDNVDKDGKAFKGYAESYIKSEVFDIYGKDKSDVNLTLTEQMLSAMVPKSVEGGLIITFADEEQGAKAHGHIHGIKRKTAKGGITKVRRDFFGVPEETQIEILKEVVKDYNDFFDFETVQQQVDTIDG